MNKDRNNELDILEIIAVLIKHKKLIIITTSIAAVIAVIFSIISLILPPEKSPLANVYRAESIIRINDSSSSGGISSIIDSTGMGALAGLMGAGGYDSSKESDFVISLAKGNTIVDAISEEFDLTYLYNLSDSKFPITATRKAVLSRLSINEETSTSTIQLSYEDNDRVLATKIVNKFVEHLESRFANLNENSNTSQMEVMEDKILEVEAQISYLQDEILKFQDKHNIMDPKAISETIGNRIVYIKTALVEKEAAIATYQSKSRIEDPSLIKLKDEKIALENSLIALENGSVDGIPSLLDLPIILMEYEDLSRNLEVQSTIYATLLQQLELLKLQEGGTGPKFQIIEYAEIPEMKSGPSRGKLCIFVTFSFFLLSVFFVMIKEYTEYVKKDTSRMNKLKNVFQ